MTISSPVSTTPTPTLPKPFVCIGIDPGLKGATVALRQTRSGPVHRGFSHSTVKRLPGTSLLDPVDYERLSSNLLAGLGLGHWTAPYVFIEQAIVMSGQGGSVTIGANWGIIVAVWASKGGKLSIAHPRTWQGAMLGNGAAKAHGKKAAILALEAAGVTVPPRTARVRVPDDGYADALVLALYGARVNSIEIPEIVLTS